MGLQQAIGYKRARANRLQLALQRVAATPSLSRVLSRLVTPIDRLTHRISKGRITVSGALVAFPVVVLETVGARSGQTRRAPLVAIPIGADLAVIGSNAGIGTVPGWAHNLRANPAATVTLGDRTVPVLARAANPEEYEQAFATASKIYPGFAGYRERVRVAIPVFVLSVAAATGRQWSTDL